MIVEFQTNLGSADATRLDLDFAKCRMGCVVEVSSPVGEALVRRQLAADVTPQPVKVEEPIVEADRRTDRRITKSRRADRRTDAGSRSGSREGIEEAKERFHPQ